jgi:16S rRNA (adenine1518-N6/adenine1519-N6)-dimethyltransferase
VVYIKQNQTGYIYYQIRSFLFMPVSVKTQIQQLLAARGLCPQKMFGQSFLLDTNLRDFIASYAAADDWVLEVGPGTGRLTEKLLANGAEVLAVEIDRGLAAWLRETFGGRENFQLLNADVLAGKNALNPAVTAVIAERARGRNLRCVANLPYATGTAFIANLCASSLPWQTAVFLAQKEVAERLAAAPGAENYGILTARMALAGTVKILRTVPPDVFYPLPTVQSALVKIEFLPAAERMRIPWADFDRLLKIIFSARRKTLGKALRRAAPLEKLAAVFAALGIDPQRRGETLAPRELLALTVGLADGQNFAAAGCRRYAD